MPYTIEAICPKCNKKAKEIIGVEMEFGWRIVNGKKKPQSQCKKCRSKK
tara:strand:+ start:1119 stop:1265 length:147 start_codon:yes stop_codon:yes gene_type:complete